jgi:DNA recombination protein RmuC
MDTLTILGMFAFSCLLLLVVLLQVRKLSILNAQAIDLSPVLNRMDWLQTIREQADRSARDEAVRNRLEQNVQSQGLRSEVVSSLTGIGDSLSGKLEGFSRLNDQRTELLRSGLEQRLDFFTTESGRKVDGLTQSLVASSAKVQDDLSNRLLELKLLWETTIKETHKLQNQQSDSTLSAIRILQTAVDTRLSTVAQQTTQSLSEMEKSLRAQAQQLRQETGISFNTLGDSVLSTLTSISQMQKAELAEIRTTVDARLLHIQAENEKKLEQMRQTVDEKLQGTLEARLGESFKQVSERLEQVYMGLGEMKTLATGVGDLKRVLTNVKTRGMWGEVQLGAIMEDILTSDQFEKNVATSRTGERVEYAVKLPGRDGNNEPVWLPIDAKFPLEDYQRLIHASERGDGEAVERASRQLETTLRVSAKLLSEKYLEPPFTTDFGILFLPAEGLYAEAVRRPGLAESILREHRVVLSGPSTVAAVLNALQMGFRTQAIQKRSSEVWETLGSVKSEFGKYADVLARVKKKLGEAQNTIESAEARTRAIQRRLRDVASSEQPELVGEVRPEHETLDETPFLVVGD